MIFNLERKNNRNMLDLGDNISFLLTLTATNKHLDPITVITIIAAYKRIDAEFNKGNPKEGIIEPVKLPQAFLEKEIAKVYNDNLKLRKKKGKEPEAIILNETEEVEQEFNLRQLEQLQSLLKLQNQTITEIVKSIVLATIPKEEAKKKSTTEKKKTEASS